MFLSLNYLVNYKDVTNVFLVSIRGVSDKGDLLTNIIYI